MKTTLVTWVIAIACAAAPGAADAQTPPATPAATPTAASTLAAAREDLRVSQITYGRIQEQLVEYLLREGANSSAFADYALYLTRVRGMLDAQQEAVRQMEALTGGLDAPRTAELPSADEQVFDPAISTSESELAKLDRQLSESLRDFDAYLLEEQYEARRRIEQIDQQSSEEMTELAREAAEAVERLRDKGIDIETGSPPGSPSGSPSGSPPPGEGKREGQGTAGGSGPEGEEGGEQPGEAGTPGGSSTQPGEGEGAGGSPGTEPGQPGGPGEGSGTGGGAGGSGEPNAPPGSGTPGPGGSGDAPPPNGGDNSPEDDDIVARQLREAAERETDPELKKKLWEEYYRYKGSK
ncbi:MAG: hypothetical protein GY715_07230 [Planctomycetes bacterium]|nr:hypothetical protein [Planctomycetota bacterium]